MALEKTEGTSHTAAPLALSSFKEDPRICPVHYVKAYLRAKASLRTSDRLFITLSKPHSLAAASTICLWLKNTILMSGQTGSGGSTRSASSSRALLNGASLPAVLAAGDWARVSTFKKFYYKPEDLDFQRTVWS